jgi:hypothetical protein
MPVRIAGICERCARRGPKPMKNENIVRQASELFKKINQDEGDLSFDAGITGFDQDEQNAALLAMHAIAGRQNRPQDDQKFTWREMVNACYFVKETFEHDLIQKIKERATRETGFEFTLYPAEEPPIAA